MERAGVEAGAAPTPAPAAAAATTAGGGVAKAKSCKGCLYYSSVLRSQARGPVCVGITRDIPKVSERMIGQIELEALQAGRKLSDFKYGCIGYSIYLDDKETSTGLREKKPHSQLPACIGVELLSDRKHHADKGVPAYHKKEDPAAPTYHNKEAPQPHQHKPGTPQPHQHKPGPPQPHRHKPGHVGDGFLSKFQRNARLVANGVAKNMNKVGIYIKDTVGDMMDKRPK